MNTTGDQNKFPDVVELNVGGTHYTTSLLTLTKCRGNMLSAMFSGKYAVSIDKNGCYFIDADGSKFIHVLNYLRYGELPSPDMAKEVYREAVYFGINEMIQELEKVPSVMAKIQRGKFTYNFPRYQDSLETIINSVLDLNVTDKTSEVAVLIFAEESIPSNEDFNKNHLCVHNFSEGKTLTPVASLGPWSLKIPEKDVMNCLLHDIQLQGFVATCSYLGTCDYSYEGIGCEKHFYKICFHWWKS